MNKIIFYTSDAESYINVKNIVSGQITECISRYYFSASWVDYQPDQCSLSHLCSLIDKNVKGGDRLIIILSTDYLSKYFPFVDVHRSILLEYPEVSFFFEKSSSLFSTWTGPEINKALDGLPKEFTDDAKEGGEYLYDKIRIRIEEYLRTPRAKREENSKSIANTLMQLVLFMEVPKFFQGFHEVDLSDEHFLLRLMSYNNLFDASNLRHALRSYLFSELSVQSNYYINQHSRSNNLALVVEEEKDQCLYNSYALYTNGYRSLPISSALLLKECSTEKAMQPNIVIRDYDLQFSDEKELDEQGAGNNAIDYIRGLKRHPDGEWENLLGCGYIWNPQWYTDKIVYFVTYGDGFGKRFQRNTFRFLLKGEEILELPGQLKPVTGFYHYFHNFKPIRQRYEEILKNSLVHNERILNDHSTPLKVYDIALRMIVRAEKYYNEEDFLFSAIVAREALEILNCFHKSLSFKAYYVFSKAENALSMMSLGGDENELIKDCKLRIQRIKMEIQRIARGSDSGKLIKKNVYQNVLNQIYADCRQYCHEKEHFQSEEVFIDAMAKLNDGIDSESPSLFIKDAKEKFKSPQKLLSNVKDNVTMWCTDTINTIIEYGKEKKE